MASVDESQPSVDEARKVFYSAGDYHLARTLQEEEYEKKGVENKELRQRIKLSLGQSMEDHKIARKILKDDEQMARALQEEEDEQSQAAVDQTVAEELQHQLSLEEDSLKAARELQDEEFAKYVQEKQEARQKELLQRQQQLQEEEARRLQEEEVKKWREKEKTAVEDQEFAKEVQQLEQQRAQKERERQEEDEALARQLQRSELHQYRRAQSQTGMSPPSAQADATKSLPANLASGQGGQVAAAASSPGKRRSLQEVAKQADSPPETGVTHLANPDEPGDAVLVPKMNKRRVAKKK